MEFNFSFPSFPHRHSSHLLQLVDVDCVGRFSPQLVLYCFLVQQDLYMFPYTMWCFQLTSCVLFQQLQWASMLWHVCHSTVVDVVAVGCVPVHLLKLGRMVRV